MPPIKDYKILIEQAPHKGESKELLTTLNNLTGEIKKLRSDLQKGTKPSSASSTEELSKKFNILINKLEKLNNSLKQVDKLTRSKDISKELKDLASEMSFMSKGVFSSASKLTRGESTTKFDKTVSKSISDLNINLKALTKKIGNVSPTKKVAIVDLETGPAGAGKRLGGQVDFITQIGVMTATLKDVLEKSGKELRAAAKVTKISVKPPAGMKEEEYNKLYEKIKKSNKSFEQIPWKEISSEGLELKKALEKAADTIGDAEIIIGHNIKDFDLKVLNDAIKESGAIIKLAAKEYYDTLEASRKQFPKRGSHGLENYRKQFEIEGKKYSEAAHTATADVEVVADLMKRLAGITEKLAAAEHKLTETFSHLDKDVLASKQHFNSLANTLDDVSMAYEDFGSSAKELTDVQGKVKHVFKEIVIKDVKKLKSAIQASVIEPRIIGPTGKEADYKYKAGKGVAEVRERLYGEESKRINELSKSLKKLQDNIVVSLERGMRSGLAVVKDEFGEAFKLGKGGREWELKILDVDKIKKELKTQFGQIASPEWGAESLIEAYKGFSIKSKAAREKSADVMAASIYNWLKKVGPEEIEKSSPYIKELHGRIKSGETRYEEGRKELGKRADLRSVYETTAVLSEVIKELQDPSNRILKTITVPTARIGEEGIPAFQTKYGSQRSLASFATLTTGLERLVKEFESLGGGKTQYAEYLRQMSRIPIRPGPEERSTSEKLASELINRIESLGGRKLSEEGYRKAITLRRVERGKIKEPLDISKSLAGVVESTSGSLEDLRKEAASLGVDALDVANALNKIDFENFYDVLDKLYNAGETPFMQRQGKMIMEFPRNLRQIAEIKEALSGIMPLVEPGRPKRKPYDEAVVKILSKATGKLFPEQQKETIVDITNVWQEMSDVAKKLYPGLPGKQIPEARPIDLSDSASSQITQFNLDASNVLKALDKTMISASTAGIRGLAPFEQFSAIQRQMSYAANAIAGALPAGKRLEVPAIVSRQEAEMIEKGKYGSGGYGLNIITELRDTAGTFEDQIIIAGRLAKMFTKITKPLVAPAVEYAQETTPIEPGTQKLSKRGLEFLEGKAGKEYKSIVRQVANEYQKVLGVPKTYRSGADVAEIGKEIVDVMREHRGSIIDVQMAKISEIFLNYFGRKLSTRFGTKGVSITPTTPPTEIKEYKDIIKGIAAGLEAKVIPGEGLGYAKMPKSMGQLSSEILKDIQRVHEIFDEEALANLTKRLQESGNKFIIDIFKDASQGLVTEKEAMKQKELFEDTFQMFAKIAKMGLGERLKSGVPGIEQMVEQYAEQFGERRKPFELRPVEARISARGVAKRGLMPEVLEGVMNNLIGSIEDTTIILDGTLTASEKLRGKINDYFESLGYRPLSKKEMAGVEKRLKAEGADVEQIAKLKKWESQWAVYSDVVDEFGKTMQSFAAPKFLQVVEEPHLYKDWTQKEIEKGIKGARLNFQAFAAYADVFAEGSSMMKELAGSTSLASREGWELIRALRMLDPALKESKQEMMSGLKEVKLLDIEGFEARTAEIKDLIGTIFDVGKYPGPFKVKIPAGKPGAIEQEELYIPGPALRSTYPEELMGGRVAPTEIARYLSNFIAAAQKVGELQEIYTTGKEIPTELKFADKFVSSIKGELINTLTAQYKRIQGMERKGAGLSEANIQEIQNIIRTLKTVLSSTRPVEPVYGAKGNVTDQQGISSQTQLGAVEAYQAQLEQDPKKYSKLFGRIMDVIIGAQPKSLYEEELSLAKASKYHKETGQVPAEYAYMGKDFEKRLAGFQKRVKARQEASTVFDIELKAGNLKEFLDKLGISVEKSVGDALERALEQLSAAKIRYREKLAEQVLGPKHAVEQVFFQRMAPDAITGKAISAVTDKVVELDDLLNILKGKKTDIKLDISNVDELKSDLADLINEHKEYVKSAKVLGYPVLKEGEIGLSKYMAKKMKVREGGELSKTTTLADLITKRKEEGREDVYATSLRYPFTGTHSLQAHKARIMESKMAQHAIAVPGAPELDIGKLNEILDTLREYVGLVPKGEREYFKGETLVEKREVAWGANQKEKADQLTVTIEKLIGVIKKATPTFIDMEQKLDFDGDALFVHTGQLEESRQNIKAHFDALGEDITSVRSLFSTLFTGVKETGTKSLSEQAYIFGKKQPSEKGYEWLTKPTIRKNVENLDMKEVMTALFAYSSDFTEMTQTMKALKKEKKPEAAIKAYGEESFSKWSSQFISSDILGEAFRKTATTIPQQERYKELLKTSEAGTLVPKEFEKGSIERVISDVIEELVRTKLYQQKYNDAIIGQLYKLHTGPTVEGISRLARMTELETGFGKGLAGTGEFAAEPSKEFLAKWPKESVALGGRPTQEFAARMNEIMRFVIQKGMDEKHAGVRAIGNEILGNIGRRQGVEEIMMAMNAEKKQFDELWDFNDQIATSIKLRMGKLPTEDIKKEVALFRSGEAGKPIDLAEITGTRSQMIEEIVKYVDIEAFFKELFRQIKRTAIKGLARQLEAQVQELPIEQAIKKQSQAMRMGGYEVQASQSIEKELAEKGINIREHITGGLQPLYGLRTSVASLAGVAEETGVGVEVPPMVLPKDEERAKRLLETYTDVSKVSRVLGRHMAGAMSEQFGDVHSLMVLTAMQKRYESMVELRERAEKAGVPFHDRERPLPTEKMGFDVPGLGKVSDVPKLAFDVWEEVERELAPSLGKLASSFGEYKGEDIKSIIAKFKKYREVAASKVESLSQMAGIPTISKEEENIIYAETFSKKQPDILENIDSMVSQLGGALSAGKGGMDETKAKELAKEYGEAVDELTKFQTGMVEQLRRVSESMRDLPFKEEMFEKLFPGFEKVIGKQPARLVDRSAIKEAKKIEDLNKQRMSEQLGHERKIHEFLEKDTAARIREVEQSAKAYKEPDIEVEKRKMMELARATDEISRQLIIDILREKQAKLKKLSGIATGGINITEGRPTDEVTELYKQYRASGLAGGGGYTPGGQPPAPQTESILKGMLGIDKASLFVEATGFRGSALHQKKQKEFIKKYGEENVDTEGFIEDLDNEITGHYDVLYRKTTEAGKEETHLVDIKAIFNEAAYNKFLKVAEDIKTKKTTLVDYIKELSKSQLIQDREIARRLEGYVSQINFYLSKFKDIGAIGEIFLTSMTDPSKPDIALEIGVFDKVRFERDVKAVNEARGAVLAMISSIGTGQIPERLEQYKHIYEEFLKSLGTEAPTVPQAKAALPKTVASKVLRQIAEENQRLQQLGRERLSFIQEDIFENLSKEYLKATIGLEGSKEWSSFKGMAAAGGAGAGMPPPPTPPAPPGGGDDGGDDEYEKYRKRIEALLSRVRPGGKIDPITTIKLLDALYEVEEKYLLLSKDTSEQLINSYRKLVNQLETALGTFEPGGLEGAMKFGKFTGKLKSAGGEKIRPEDLDVFRDLQPDPGGPDKPSALHANLKLMLLRATKRYKLADTDVLKGYGEGIKELIEKVKSEGPGMDISGQIMKALEDLPEGKRAGFRKVWQFYRQAVGEYFIKQLEELKNDIEESASEAESRQLGLKYKEVLDRYVKNIKNNLAKGSDIYTEIGMGGVREWVDPELAQKTGLFRSKEELMSLSKQRSAMAGEFQPIFNKMVEDLNVIDIEKMTPPIEKVRAAFESLAAPDKEIADILKDTELFGRLGEEAIKKWDFSKLLAGITQLRAGLESYHKMRIGGGRDDYVEAHRKNLEETIRYFKQLEKTLTPVGGTAGSPRGLIGVPQFLGAGTQEMLHKRNIAKMIEYYKTPKEEGGPKRGEVATYRWKVVDPASKQTLKSFAEDFKKVGESADDAGNKVSLFRHKSKDLVKQLQSRTTVGQAFARVMRWGLASTVIYGSITAMRGMISVIADVESGIAMLRQVMSPLETNFDQITDAALRFAKEFGQPIRNVVDSMRVFAQQGLAQSEVIDRTRTSVLAANVSTLSAADATEALTAASKIYGREGESSIRFLNAWNEVEAKHAITSMDLANALKKAAAAAKTSGFTFDELNAIITGIGATSRQTGKEIGTSLRFIFRRMQSQKGPKALSEVGVSTLTPVGDIKPGFKILGDLADKWGELSNAQRLSIAQAIGGRRHYNSLIILMDHWNEAVETLEDSINSKGAAERRNAIVMETYAKKLQQVRSAMNELQVQFGRFALPIAKIGLSGLKFLIEAFTNIPPAVKIAMTAIGSLFFLMAKGAPIVEKLFDSFAGAENVFSDLFSSLKNEASKSLYEIFGKTSEVFGKKMNVEQFYAKGTKTEGLKKFTEVEGVRELETFLGRFVYTAAKAGRAWNNFLTDLSKSTATTSKKIGTVFDYLGDALFGIDLLTAGKFGKASPFVAAFITALGTTSEMSAYGFEKMAKYIGLTSQQMAKLTQSSTGVAGSLGPMIGSFFVLKPLLEKSWVGFKRLTVSAQDYEKSIDGIRRKTGGELASIKSLSAEYNKLSRRLGDIKKLRDPEVKRRAVEREEYKSPTQELGKLYDDSAKYANKLAGINIDLVSSFDEFGNAVLKSTNNLKAYINLMKSAKIKEMADVELDVLGKYVEDLTKTGGAETFKYELKTFLKEIPVVGDLLSKSIKMAPAKELDIITEKMNNLLALRSKYPLTTTFDVDISEFKGKLAAARKIYQITYKDFRRVLTELPTAGLTAKQISSMLGGEKFEKGFELMVGFEPKLQIAGLKGKVDWKDVLGAEVLKKIYPEKPIDFAAPLTKGLLEQGNAVKRKGAAFAGDVVLFTEDISKKYDIAGDQAILKMKKTTDGMVQWTVEYFDKELMGMAEVPYSKVERFVDSIFPTIAMKDRLADNIEVLKEFVAGAGAGLRGITEAEFKREFSLGERFFSQIPTTTLLQTTKGFEPGKGFGQVGFKSGWDKWIRENFFEPMVEYRQMLERAEKMKLEVGEAEMAPGLAEDISKLQEILKNNQVVIQYRAAHEDLMKILSESSRVLKENIIVEQNRSKYVVQSSGYLKGLSEDMSDLNIGIQKYTDLTAQQRMLFREKQVRPEDKTFTNLRQSFKEDTMSRESLVKSISDIDKTLIAVKEIGDVARSFGAALPMGELEKYVEEVAKTGDKGTGLLLSETKNVTSNTADTVDRLDQLLEQGGDEKAIERMVNRPFLFTSSIVDKLEYLAEKRNKYASKDNLEMVTKLDRAMDGLVNRLIERVGPEKAMKMVRKNAPLFFGKQDFTQAEFIKRGFSNINFEGFSKAMERVQPGITKTKEFKSLLELQEDQGQKQIVSNKNMNKLLAAYSTFEHFNKVSSNKQIKRLDDQIYTLEAQQSEAEKSGKNTAELISSLDALKKERAATIETMEGQRMRELIAPIAIASQELAKSFGMTEKEIRILGGTVASTYLAWKIWSKLTGEPIPEYLKEVGEKAKEAAKRMTKEGVKGKAWQAYYAGKESLKGLFGKDLEEDIKRTESTIKKTKILSEEDLKRAKETIIYGGIKAEESVVGIGKEKPLREKIDLAIKEARRKKVEKGSTTEEKILNENESQTGILHGIYEQTKKGAENTTDFTKGLHKEMQADKGERADEVDAVIGKVDTLRSEYLERRGVGVSPFKKITAMLLAATAAGYVEEKRGEVGRFSELGKRAKKQTELINAVLKKYPDVAAEALEEYRKKVVKAAEEEAPIETEKRQRAVETVKFEDEMVERLRSLKERMRVEYNEINMAMEESADRMAKLELAEEMQKQLEALENTIRSSKAVQEFQNKFITEISGVLSGFRMSQVNLSEQGIFDISAGERLTMLSETKGVIGKLKPHFLDLSRALKIVAKGAFETVSRLGQFKKLFHGITLGMFKDTYADMAKEFENMYRNREVLGSRAVAITEELSTMEGKPLTGVERDRYKQLEEQLKKVTDRIEDLNESLAESAIELQKAQFVEKLRTEALKAGIEARSAFAGQLVESLAVTSPFDYMGRRGLGTGDFGLRLPQAERDLTVGQRLISELSGVDNQQMLASVRAYSALNISIAKNVEMVKQGGSRLVQLKAELKETGGMFGFLGVKAGLLRFKMYQQKEANEKATEAIDIQRRSLEKLSSVMSGLNFAQLANDFASLKESFITSEQSARFREITENVDKIIGGPHPEATVYPTYAMLQAGVSPELSDKLTKYDAELARLRGSGQRVSAAQIGEIKYREKVDKYRWDQEIENRKLQEQRGLGGRYDEALTRAIRRAEEQKRPEDVKRLGGIRNTLEEGASTMNEVLEKKEGVKYYKGMAETLSDVEKELEIVFKELEIVLPADPIIMAIGKQTYDLIKGLGFRRDEGVFSDIISKIIPPSIFEPVSALVGVMKHLITALQIRRAAEISEQEKAVGGLIFGRGGPREDRVPIMASPGEYVVNTSSAKSIGYQNLEYMNKMGQLPGFATGGEIGEEYKQRLRFINAYGESKYKDVFGETGEQLESRRFISEYGKYPKEYIEPKQPTGKEYKPFRLFDTASRGMEKAIDYLSEKRLGMIEEAWMEKSGLEGMPKRMLKATTGPQFLAAGELGVRMAKIPAEMLGMLENTMGWAISGNVKEDMGNIVKGIKNLTLNDVGNIASIVGTSFVEDFKKGGLGITAGIIDTLFGVRRIGKIGGGVVEYLAKQGETAAIKKSASLAVGKGAKTSKQVAEEMLFESKLPWLSKEAVTGLATPPGYEKVAKTLGTGKGGLPWLPEGAIKELSAAPGYEKISKKLSIAKGLLTGEAGGFEVVGAGKKASELAGKIAEKFTSANKGLTNLGYDLADAAYRAEGGWSKKTYIESMKQARESILKKCHALKSKKGLDAVDKINMRMRLASQAQGINEGLAAVKLIDAMEAGVPLAKLPKLSVSIETAKEIIAGKRIPLKLYSGGSIPAYDTGIDYVPSNQFAYLHKGEAVVPAEYNMGGVVGLPKFGLGGAVNDIKERATDLGENIAKAIRKELEDVTLSVDKTPLPIETTELTISNVESLDRLADTLSNLNTNVGVGADEASSKIDDFIEAANSKFENFTEIIERHDGDINEVQTSLFSLADSSREVNSLNDKLVGLEQSISDILSKQDFFVSTANDDSKLEAKLNELVKYIEDTHIARLNSDVRLSTVKIDKLDLILNNALDLFDGLSSRFNLQEV